MSREIKWLGKPYLQPGFNVDGTPYVELDTIGQTRYQEYDPVTGAAIGAPMTQAEFDARGGLQRIPTVRAVFVPGGPLFSNASLCQRLLTAANHTQEGYEELVKTRTAMVQAGVLPYAMIIIDNAIAAALDNVNKIIALAKQVGCSWATNLFPR